MDAIYCFLIMLIWLHYTSSDADVFFAMSNDNGQTFSIPTENISNNIGQSFYPQISSIS